MSNRRPSPGQDRFAEDFRFPAGLVAELRSDDMDEVKAAAAGWDQEYHQVGAGRFQGRLFQANTADLQIGTIGWNASIIGRGATPAGCVVFGLTTHGRAQARLSGVPITGAVLATVGDRGEFDFRTEGEHELLVASVRRSVIDRVCVTMLGAPWAELKLARAVQMDPGAVRGRLLARMTMIMDHARQHPGSLADPASAGELENQAVIALLQALDQPPIPVHPAHRHRMARRAEEYLVANRERPVTIHELCAAVGAAERTLHLGFREYFGLPPMAHLRMLRLNAAHRALRAADRDTGVTEVAMRYGFLHLGEFAAAYRRLFGEPPSETLRSALWRRHGAALGNAAAGLQWRRQQDEMASSRG